MSRKKCGICLITKSKNQFNKRNDSLGIKYLCRKCELVKSVKYNKEHRKRLNILNRKRKENIKKWVNRYLKNKPCLDCKIKYHPYCMDFDHVDGRNKTRTIATLVGDGYSKSRILKEISKCDLICANCHRLRTFKRGWNRWKKRKIVKYEE